MKYSFSLHTKCCWEIDGDTEEEFLSHLEGKASSPEVKLVLEHVCLKG